MTKLNRDGWMPVRKPCDGPEFLDRNTLGLDRDDCEQQVARLAVSVPGWNAHNPVVRIAKVRISEIAD